MRPNVSTLDVVCVRETESARARGFGLPPQVEHVQDLVTPDLEHMFKAP